MSTKKVSNEKTNWLLIALIVIFASILWVLIFQDKPVISSLVSKLAVTSNPTNPPNPSPDLTVDWQTYTNTQYLYSLKYPKMWLAKSFGPGLGGLQPLNTSSRGVIFSSNNQETTNPNPMFEIQVDGPENLSRPAYSEWERKVKASFGEQYKLTKESLLTISGITATVLEGEHVYPKTSTYIKQFIFTSSEGGVYFTITIASDTKQESLIFDQILSTFKFTN